MATTKFTPVASPEWRSPVSVGSRMDPLKHRESLTSGMAGDVCGNRKVSYTLRPFPVKPVSINIKLNQLPVGEIALQQLRQLDKQPIEMEVTASNSTNYPVGIYRGNFTFGSEEAGPDISLRFSVGGRPMVSSNQITATITPVK